MNDSLTNTLLLLNYGWEAILLVVVVVAYYLFEPARWILYCKNVKPTKAKNIFSVFGISALANYILPFKLSIPTKFFLIKKETDLKPLTILLIFTFDGATYYLFWVIFSITLGHNHLKYILDSFSPSFNIHSYSCLISFFAVLFLSFLFFVYFKARSNLLSKLAKLKNSIAFFSSLSRKNKFFILNIMWVDILFHILSHQIVFSMLNIKLNILETASITVLSITAGLLSMMPMGIIGYDATMFLILNSYYDTNIEICFLVPLLIRISNIIACFILGCVGGASLKINPITFIKKTGRKVLQIQST